MSHQVQHGMSGHHIDPGLMRDVMPLRHGEVPVDFKVDVGENHVVSLPPETPGVVALHGLGEHDITEQDRGQEDEIG